MMTPLSEKQNRQINMLIHTTSPSDRISIGEKEVDFLIRLWCDSKIEEIPSDIFFANTIPLKDCVLDFEDGSLRVTVFEQQIANLHEAKEDQAIPVGAISGGGTTIPIVAVKGFNNVMYAGVGWERDSIRQSMEYWDADDENLEYAFLFHLGVWYGIQIALLHPTLKEVFKSPQRTPYEGGNSPNKHHHKRKVKYIRKHYITLDKLEKALETQNEGRKINRKCLAWYVIGHWRTYKSGKMVFIQPHWRGVLRDLKRNANGDERERVIDTGGYKS